jgi:3-(3-hydroxy-phenyl)propionate hydroxylase
MTDHAVVIAGGGPTGMMLAGELALAGVDVAIVERRPGSELAGSRAGGLHSRTIEILDQRGIADRFLSQGTTVQVASFSGIPLDISDCPTRHNYVLALWQNRIEEIMAGWVDELAVPIYRGREVTGFAQEETAVHVEISDGQSLRTQYLVGCDGGRSLVRKAAGIGFPGWDASTSSLIAEVEVSEEPELGLQRDEKGIHALGRLRDGERVRVVVREEHVGQSGEPTLRDLSQALVAVRGTDYGVHSPTWISRFTDTTRQAASYREGRVLLAGDAAHVHYPVGGQGLNTGVQDAVNLGWKLAQVVKRTSPSGLLDTYQAERHPVAARVLQNTMAGTALARSDARIDALRETMSELLSMDRRLVAGVHPPTRCAASAPEPRCARRRRHLPVGGSGPADRCRIHRLVGAPGTRHGRRSERRVDPAGRICRLGRRGLRLRGTSRRANHVVRRCGCREVVHQHRLQPPRMHARGGGWRACRRPRRFR